MIEAINRATLKSKLANSNIQFANYDEYERMQGLIDSCAELHAIPIGYIEMWIDQHRDTSGSAGYYLRWMMEDYLNLGKGIFSEDDFTIPRKEG
jgi:hypothetical protein